MSSDTDMAVVVRPILVDRWITPEAVASRHVPSWMVPISQWLQHKRLEL